MSKSSEFLETRCTERSHTLFLRPLRAVRVRRNATARRSILWFLGHGKYPTLTRRRTTVRVDRGFLVATVQSWSPYRLEQETGNRSWRRVTGTVATGAGERAGARALSNESDGRECKLFEPKKLSLSLHSAYRRRPKAGNFYHMVR